MRLKTKPLSAADYLTSPKIIIRLPQRGDLAWRWLLPSSTRSAPWPAPTA